MMLKKFYGKSIKEARVKAKGSLGQTYIVVETKEANGKEPAWIHVLDEENESSTTNKGSVTYSRRDLFPKALSKLKETVNDSLQLFNLDGPKESDHSLKTASSEKAFSQKDERFLPYRSVARSIGSDDYQEADTQKSADLKKEFQALARRFGRLETLVSEQVLGASIKFISHPAFQQLLANGVPCAMITSWFNELLGQGIDPFNYQGSFTQLLAQKVRQVLDVAANGSPAKFMVFTGSSGAGKSSLIMKLALHPKFLADASCAFISVIPGSAKNCYPPLAVFASEYDLVHFTINTKDQWNELQDELAGFDHVLIEMPAAELQSTSTLSVEMFRKVLANTASLEVHHVVNAALNQENLAHTTFNDFTSDYLDFTHLDAAPKKGHLLPLMQKPGCKIRYVSSGLQVPEDINNFNPAHFARQLLSNA